MARDHNWHSWALDFDELGVWINGHEYGFFAGAVQLAGNVIEAVRLDAHDGGTVMIREDHQLFPYFKESVLRTPWMMGRIACWRDEVAA